MAGRLRRLWRTRTTASSTIVYGVEPGKRIRWHTDATEETQYIIAGTGKLDLEDGTTHQAGPGSVFVLPTPMRHDLENTGKETLCAVAFFAAAMFTQDFDQVDVAAEEPHPRHAEPRRLRSHMRPWVVLTCAAISLATSLVPARSDSPNGVRTLNPPGAIKAVGTWSLGARAGDFIFIAGIQGIDLATNKLVEDPKRAFAKLSLTSK